MTPPTVAVFGSSTLTASDPGYRDAARLGELLGRAGATVATGGYGGAMEAVSEGASSTGVPVIGVTAPTVFPDRSGVNAHVTEEVPARTISERIHRIVDLADAWIVLPGSIGTLTELMVAWNTAFVAPFSGRTPPPLIAVGAGWRQLVRHLDEHHGCPGDLVECVETPEDAVAAVRRGLPEAGWSSANG